MAVKKFACAVILNNAGEVLLLRRSWSANYKPFYWCLPGGHLEPGESPESAVVREVNEELTIILPESDYELFETVIGKVGDNEYRTSYFITNLTDNQEIILNFEHDKYQYVSYFNLLDYDLIPELHDFLEELFTDSISFNNTILQSQLLNKGFNDLLGVENIFQKGILDKSKLILKKVTNSAGKTIQRWVRGGAEPITKDKIKTPVKNAPGKGNKKPNPPQEPEKDPDFKKKADEHVKVTNTEDLQKYVAKNAKNKDLDINHAVRAAKAELQRRGVKDGATDNPGEEDKYKHLENIKNSLTQKVQSKEHLDRAHKFVDDNQNLSSGDKKHIKEHLKGIEGKVKQKELENSFNDLFNDKKADVESSNEGKDKTEENTKEEKSKEKEAPVMDNTESNAGLKDGSVDNGTYKSDGKFFNKKEYLKASGVVSKLDELSPEQKQDADIVKAPNGKEYDKNTGAGIEDALVDKNSEDYKKVKSIQNEIRGSVKQLINGRAGDIAGFFGAPGIGKDYILEDEVNKENRIREKLKTQGKTGPDYDPIKITKIDKGTLAGILETLQTKNSKNDIILFSDNDKETQNEDIINLLKKATNTGSRGLSGKTKMTKNDEKRFKDLSKRFEDVKSGKDLTPEDKPDYKEFLKLAGEAISFDGKIVISSNVNHSVNKEEHHLAEHYDALSGRSGGKWKNWDLKPEQKKMMLMDRVMGYVPEPENTDELGSQKTAKIISAPDRVKVMEYLSRAKIDPDKISTRLLTGIFEELGTQDKFARKKKEAESVGEDFEYKPKNLDEILKEKLEKAFKELLEF